MKHILVISFSNLKTDSRVRRHVNSLKKNYKLTVACLDAEPAPDYTLILLPKAPLTFFRKIKLALMLGLRLFKQASKLQYPYFSSREQITNPLGLVFANDIESLPLAFHVAEKHKCPVVFDAHEYAPRHFEDKFLWRLFFQPLNIYLCKTYIPKVAAMITIGRGLANEYEKNFHVKPVIITNANYFASLTPSVVLPNKIRLVHHGIATPSRKLELMIDMMNHLDDRFTLDMYLMMLSNVSSKTMNYPEWLKQRAAETSRVRILDPIKSDEIVRTINQYDMGVFLVPPVNFNYQNTLPNKLFDFIQARLAVAVGPTPEMAEIVKHYNLGVVSDDFTAESLAAKIQAITAGQLTEFKSNASLAASQLNAEENEKILLRLIADVFQKSIQ